MYVQGLAALVERYAKEHEDVKQSLARNNWALPPPAADLPQYYNNFEVVRLSTFQRPDVQAWLDELVSDPERIYKWRWGEDPKFISLPKRSILNTLFILHLGDAPIRFATVNMFLDVSTEVEMFCGIPYRHFESRGTLCGCE